MVPIEAGNGISQILMKLCVHVGLVKETTFQAKILPGEVSLPWQRQLSKNGHFGLKFDWQATEFKECLDLNKSMNLSNQNKPIIYDKYMTLACYNEPLTMLISIPNFSVRPLEVE